MEQQNGKAEGEREGEARGAKEGAEENQEMAVAGMSRKEKRKAMKKMKRKQLRKEMAEKEKEDAEARLNDPAEQERLRTMEEEEARRREKELKEFEERERAWMEAIELKRKKEEEEEEAEAERQEEERRRKHLEESEKLEVSEKNESCEDDEWEYVEEGPPEIIFQGNEIILRKKKVKVPKKPLNEIADRPTSNPLPPQTEDFADYQNASSAQHVLENVAQQVPNFGTEQDKAHCPFHLKTGACRFGQRCSRVHFYPDKSCTLLMKNMYNGPGISWDQDEGLEYTDEEVERYYEEFYEDVHTEFLKYGEIVNFKVCRNGSFHLRGNVYVHYKSLESAVLAYQAINGRYFAGKQVKCEFVNVTRWKVAICGEYMKSRLKACSRGTACNFIHCFRNPGGDYEWADWDKPPPRYWVKKMVALFGYSDEYLEQLEHEHPKKLKDSSKVVSADSNRQRSRRSRSTDIDHVNDGPRGSYRNRNYHVDTWESSRHHRLSRSKEYGNGESVSVSGDTEDSNSDREVDEDQWYVKRKLRRESKWSEYSPGYRVPKKRTRQSDYDDDSSDEDKDHKRHSGYKRKSSRHYSRGSSEDRVHRLDKGKEKRLHYSHSDKSLRECSREGSLADHGDGDEDHGVDAAEESYKRDRYKHGHHQEYRSGSEQLHKITETRVEFDARKKTTHDIASPGDSSEGESAKSGHHEHKRRGSEPRIDVSVEPNDQVKNEKRSLDAKLTGYSSDRDWNKSRHHRHKRSPGHHDKVLGLPHNHRNSEERKPSHKSNKRRDHETDSDTDRLDRSRKGKRYDSQRRSSGNGESVSESPEHHGNYDEERSDNETHRERHHHHKRRHSTHHRRSSEAPESDPYANPNYNKPESGAYRSRDEVVCEPVENIDWMDRWRP